MRILRVTDAKKEFVDDNVIEDVLFRIMVNGDLVASMNVLQANLRELTVGYLLTSSYIRWIDQIDDLSIDESTAYVQLSHDLDINSVKAEYLHKLSSASAAPHHFVVREALLNLKPELIQSIMERLNERGALFKKTGGTHSALVFHDGEVVSFMEDVGRFNALDKAIGETRLQGIDTRQVILATSGRLAGEMVLKASNVGIPVMCSVSAPIASGVHIAKMSGMTLIGFARDSRFNVYSGFERFT